MSDKTDDGLVWGWMEDGAFRVLPKGPMLMANLGPPPFAVTLPSGEVRNVTHQPAELTDDIAASEPNDGLPQATDAVAAMGDGH